MPFQKCPICEGAGQVFNPQATASFSQCRACQGAGIIDEVTGLPPVGNSFSTITATDGTSLIVVGDIQDQNLRTLYQSTGEPL